ncbi:MAG: hypothetical protein PHW73_09735 [Atribacterota bacterium]|nr:hypothetical protein [Atribacterota bacterium]
MTNPRAYGFTDDQAVNRAVTMTHAVQQAAEDQADEPLTDKPLKVADVLNGKKIVENMIGALSSGELSPMAVMRYTSMRRLQIKGNRPSTPPSMMVIPYQVWDEHLRIYRDLQYRTVVQDHTEERKWRNELLSLDALEKYFGVPQSNLTFPPSK